MSLNQPPEHMRACCSALIWKEKAWGHENATFGHVESVSVEARSNSLTRPQRVRTRTDEKEFPFENTEKFADNQGQDRSGRHGVREFHTLSG